MNSLLEGNGVQAGEFHLSIYPRPVQKLRPPVWIAAKSEEAVVCAAHRGDAWIMEPVTDINALESRIKIYRE